MIGKIFGNKSSETANSVLNMLKKEEPVFRFNQDGWETIGVQTRAKDTRTPAQIDATLDALAERIPVLREFREQIKSMKPIDRALISDTAEISNKLELLPTNIRMVENRAKDGKSILGVLLPKLIKASKENPAILKFTREILNSTDTQTSKYFLSKIAGFNPQAILERDEAIQNIVYREASQMRFDSNEKYSQYVENRIAELEKRYPIEYSQKTITDDTKSGELIDASTDMIIPIGKRTLNGMYPVTFKRQHNFLDAMGIFLNPEIRPENVRFLRKICDVLDSIKTQKDIPIDLFPFLKTNIPKSQAELNLAKLPQAVKDAEKAGKDIEATNFIMSNVNFVKPYTKPDVTRELKYVPAE